MKKIFLLIISLSMLISLCACGASEPAANIPEEPIPTPVAPTPAPTLEPTPEPTPEPKVYDHSLWVLDEAGMLSEEEYAAVVSTVEAWYTDLGHKIGIATVNGSTAEPKFYEKALDIFKQLEPAMEPEDGEPIFMSVFCTEMANGMYTSGNGVLNHLVNFITYPEYTCTPHDSMLKIIDSMDKCLREIDFNDTITTELEEMDGSKPSVSNAVIMDRIMELDIWKEPTINKCMEYDPETGMWFEGDKLNIFLDTKDPDQNSKICGISVSYDEKNGSISINVSEQNYASQGQLDENGVYTGASGYSYESRQLLKEIFTIALPGAGNRPYELLEAVLHSRYYEGISCNPSVIRWVDGHCFSIELNTKYNNMHISIGPEGDTSVYESWSNIERLNYECTYEGIFGADKFIAAYELDKW